MSRFSPCGVAGIMLVVGRLDGPGMVAGISKFRRVPMLPSSILEGKAGSGANVPGPTGLGATVGGYKMFGICIDPRGMLAPFDVLCPVFLF